MKQTITFFWAELSFWRRPSAAWSACSYWGWESAVKSGCPSCCARLERCDYSATEGTGGGRGDRTTRRPRLPANWNWDRAPIKNAAEDDQLKNLQRFHLSWRKVRWFHSHSEWVPRVLVDETALPGLRLKNCSIFDWNHQGRTVQTLTHQVERISDVYLRWSNRNQIVMFNLFLVNTFSVFFSLIIMVIELLTESLNVECASMSQHPLPIFDYSWCFWKHESNTDAQISYDQWKCSSCWSGYLFSLLKFTSMEINSNHRNRSR